MESSRIRAWVDGAGALAVLLGLVFVGLELRANTVAVRGATYQAIADASIDHTTWFASHQDLPRLVARTAEGAVAADFTPEENTLLRALYATTLRRVENIFVQVEQGLVGEDAIERFRPSEAFFANAYFREFWVSGDIRFEPRFREFFETNFRIGPPAPSDDSGSG